MEAVTTYRNNPLTFSDSESSDSDSEGDWKRNKHSEPVFQDSSYEIQSLPQNMPVIKSTPELSNNSRKRKVNTIWSSVLEEQTVTDVFTHCQLKPKPISMADRSCESYDFRRKALDNREDIFPDEADMDTNNEEKIAKGQETKTHWKRKKCPRLRPEDAQVAKKIIYKLNEKKQYLIYRIVHTVGAEKAMQLLKMTEDVEENGGMLIKNNSRRRTPGGVYIQLLKSDNQVTKAQIDEIFADEEPFYFRRDKKTGGRKMRGKKYKKRNLTLSMDVADDALPPASNSITPTDSNDSPVSTPDVSTTTTPTPNAEGVVETGDLEIEDGEILD